MSRTKKIVITVAILAMVAGLMIVAASLFAIDFDFERLGSVKYETNTHEIKDSFSSISVKTESADIVLLPSENGECKVICNEAEDMKHSVSVKDGALVIEAIDEREWYGYISLFNFGKEKITVYLPKSEYKALVIDADTSDINIPKDFKYESIDISVSTGDVSNYATCTGSVKIKASTGDIRAENISARSLDLEVSTGRIDLKNVSCAGDISIIVSTGDASITDVTSENLFTSGKTGDITLKSFIAVNKLSIERSIGEVELYGCDAGEIYIETSTGDVEGTVLTDKTFIADSSSGDIDIPRETRGGRCYVKTSTGDIDLRVKN